MPIASGADNVLPLRVAYAVMLHVPVVKPADFTSQFQYVLPFVSVDCVGNFLISLPFVKRISQVAPGVVLQTDCSELGEPVELRLGRWLLTKLPVGVSSVMFVVADDDFSLGVLSELLEVELFCFSDVPCAWLVCFGLLDVVLGMVLVEPKICLILTPIATINAAATNVPIIRLRRLDFDGLFLCIFSRVFVFNITCLIYHISIKITSSQSWLKAKIHHYFVLGPSLCHNAINYG